MGRLLETFRRHEVRTAPPRVPAEKESSAHEPAPAEEQPEAMPFIEVGPARQVDGSPEVLATPVPSQLYLPAQEGPAAAPPVAPSSPAPALAYQGAPPGEQGLVLDRLAPELVAYHDPDHPLSREYHALLRSLLAGLPGPGPRTLLFTTPLCGTPSSAVVLNLAVAAARETSRRVVAVDASGRQPGLAELLGAPQGPGLYEHLTGRAALEQVLRRTRLPGLLAMTAGTCRHVETSWLRVEPLRALLGSLALRFDLVLISGPRWDSRLDAAVLGGLSDAVYLVAGEADARSPEGERLARLITEQGVNLAGSVTLRG